MGKSCIVVALGRKRPLVHAVCPQEFEESFALIADSFYKKRLGFKF